MPSVNVVLPSGQVVSVDESVVEPEEQLGGVNLESQADEAGDRQRERKDRIYGGVVGGLASAGQGLGDTVTFGGLGKLESAIGGDEADQMQQELAAAHPYARIAGEVGGLLAPTGWLGDAAQAGSAISGIGLASKAGEAVGGGALGRLVEGGIFGVGAHVADSNATGDPLTIEGTIESAGMGAILNVGAGAVMDKLGGVLGRAADGAASSVGEASQFSRDLETAVAGSKAFDDPPPSWEDFRESHAANVKATSQYNRAVSKVADEYDDFIGSNSDLTGAIKAAEKAIDTAQNYYYAPDDAAVERTLEKQSDGTWRQRIKMKNDVGETSATRDSDGNWKTKSVDSGRVGKPVMTPELEGQFRDYREQISNLYKQKAGGYRLDALEGKWARDPSVAPDPQGALESLRSLQNDFKARYSKASGLMKDLPEAPPPPKPELPIAARKIPASLRDFARKDPATIAAIANGLDPATAQAFSQFTDDVGLAHGVSPQETVAGVHRRFGEYVASIDRVAATKTTAEAADASKPLLMRVMKRAAHAVIGHAIGGPVGMVAGMALGDAIDSGLIAAKNGIRTKVGELVAKYGKGTAASLKKLPPVVSYLGSSFVNGKRDPERSVTKRAVNRIAEIQSAARSAPDSAYMAVRPLMGHPSMAGVKIQQRVAGAMAYLAQSTPKDPGIDTTMFGSNWEPSHAEAVELAHRLEAVQDPLGAIARTLAGDGHPAATEALNAVWPAVMQEFAGEVSLAQPSLGNISYQATKGYSDLFGTPMSALQNPILTTTIQGLYMPQPTQSNQRGPAPSGPSGRPPAVQNEVAGSSVSKLIGSA